MLPRPCSPVVWTLIAGVLFARVSLAQPPSRTIKHDSGVLSLAWSADGKRLASASDDGVIILTEMPSGKQVGKLATGSPPNGIAFSSDGKLLGLKSGAQDGPLSIWDLGTQKFRTQLGFKSYTCSQLAFTPDNQTLCASGPGEHMIWNFGKGGGYGSKQGKVPEGSSAAISADGAILAWSNAQGMVQLFFPVQRRHQHMKTGPGKAMALSADRRYLGVAEDEKALRRCEVSAAEVRKLRGLRGPATLLHFSNGGKILAAASPVDRVVRLWETDTARLRRRITPTAGDMRALGLSPDGRTL